MPLPDPPDWSDLLRQALGRYDEPLLRQVAARLVRARNQWPADELIDRAAATVVNAAVIDRRLQELDPAARRLLALVARSRQPRWRLGNLVELAIALGRREEPFQPILALFESGLLYPEPVALGAARLKSFEQILGLATGGGLAVFAHPAVAARAIDTERELPELPAKPQAAGAVREADGLEWLLRLSALWQLVAAAPLRRTQGGAFFKRDLDRLRGDAVLISPPADSLAELPDPALLAVALAEAEGIVRDSDGELAAGPLPASWDDGLPRALESLYAGLFRMESWDPLDGFRMAAEGSGNPFPSAYVLVMALLGRQPTGAFVSPDDIETWLCENHPYWSQEGARPSRYRSWVGTFVLGLLYPLRVVEAVKEEDGAWAVRLSATGRWLLGLGGDEPSAAPAFPQTLLVQPNLEILAYRQGLTPALVGKLARFAAWKGLGAACLLQVQPETVYRALESGLTFETILQTLEQHGTRATPAPVIDSLRTWANKRDRITIYPSAALLEFGSAEELNEALARGVPAVRLGDRLALVAHEEDIEYKHFRLTGTRDYALPPDRCVTVEPDGVTLTIDLARSDLLLETELPRFAVPLERALANGRRQYRLTPASLAAAREGGLSVPQLEAWFGQRAGAALSPAARLLLAGAQAPSPQVKRHLVLHVATPELADGLAQWPETRELIDERLGPTALAVAEENTARLRELLRRLGMALLPPAAGDGPG